MKECILQDHYTEQWSGQLCPLPAERGDISCRPIMWRCRLRSAWPASRPTRILKSFLGRFRVKRAHEWLDSWRKSLTCLHPERVQSETSSWMIRFLKKKFNLSTSRKLMPQSTPSADTAADGFRLSYSMHKLKFNHIRNSQTTTSVCFHLLDTWSCRDLDFWPFDTNA